MTGETNVMKNQYATITALQCLRCYDIIFSNKNHTMVWCRCGAVAIDYGWGYTKCSVEHANLVKVISIDVPYEQCYNTAGTLVVSLHEQTNRSVYAKRKK